MVRPVKHNAFLGSLRCPVYGHVGVCSASLAEMGSMEVENSGLPGRMLCCLREGL